MLLDEDLCTDIISQVGVDGISHKTDSGTDAVHHNETTANDAYVSGLVVVWRGRSGGAVVVRGREVHGGEVGQRAARHLQLAARQPASSRAQHPAVPSAFVYSVRHFYRVLKPGNRRSTM